VYTLMLRILAAIARATDDFRHISYEGKHIPVWISWRSYGEIKRH